ncbi:MAG: TIGR03905 family TSCPD domain-containing protein [Clostridia bacterium]|nr:TIGR03905 family TSCPD domain-containing protein [Clostridia bacterium]
MATYRTHGTCSRAINFDVVDGKVTNVEFIGGCAGNTNGVAKLVEGMEIDEVINRLKGIPCRGNTSCPDQLARALEEYKNNN